MKINTLMCSYFINNVTPSPTTSHQEAGLEDSHALKLLTGLWKVGEKKKRKETCLQVKKQSVFMHSFQQGFLGCNGQSKQARTLEELEDT